MAGRVRCWTRQAPQVLDEIGRTGAYLAREAYVREKNGSISDYYLGLYRWLTSRCAGLVPIEPGALPIWLALTPEARLGAVEGTVSLTLDVPSDRLVVIDYDRWGYRVNDWYVPLDDADARAHDAELARLGIANESLLFTGELGNFYPAVRRKVEASWDRVLVPSADDTRNVGVCWEIERGWVVDAELA